MPARIRARVTGSSTTRILHYDIRRRPEQAVSFIDVAGSTTRVIGTFRGGGHGTLRFNPAPGSGRRTIEAQFEIAGAAAERLTVAHFSPPSTRLPRVHALRAVHLRTRVLISWTRVPGASGYDVAVSSTDDPQRRLRVRGSSVAISGIARASAGRVTVRATAPLRASPAAVAKFRTTGKAAIRFRALPKGPRLR